MGNQGVAAPVLGILEARVTLLLQTVTASSIGLLMRQYTVRVLTWFSDTTLSGFTSNASPFRHIWNRMRASRCAIATTAFL